MPTETSETASSAPSGPCGEKRGFQVGFGSGCGSVKELGPSSGNSGRFKDPMKVCGMRRASRSWKLEQAAKRLMPGWLKSARKAMRCSTIMFSVLKKKTCCWPFMYFSPGMSSLAGLQLNFVQRGM